LGEVKSHVSSVRPVRPSPIHLMPAAGMLNGCLHYRKRSSEYYDPCQDFANKSIKCMHRNNGDRDMCQDYFKCV
jgi:hypothetical protein